MKNKAKTKLKNILLFICLPLVILSLVIFLSAFIFKLYQTPSNQTFTPVKTINISEPFSAKFYFNDKSGTNDFPDLIVKNINSSKKTINIAMYSIDNIAIRDALFAAAKRGVLINLILSNSQETGEKVLLKNGGANLKFTFVGVGGTGYMHHKFMLIDQGDVNQKLFFGSYNFTELQGKFDPSFIMETSRPEIINVFSEEFNRLTSDQTWQAKKAKDYNPFAAKIKYPEGDLEIWFTPEPKGNSLKDRMLSLIKNANSNLKIMTWYITDKDIAAALISRAKTLPITIITDDFNWSNSSSVFPIMAAQKDRQKLDNLQMITDVKRNAEVQKIIKDDTFNSFLHHHLLIIDDTTAVFGTNNWSSGGFFLNDESIMISNIRSVVSAFEQSYLLNYNLNR